MLILLGCKVFSRKGIVWFLPKIIRRILIHVLVNFAVVIAIFLMSAYFVDVLERVITDIDYS
jgi:hypothetical protein